MMWFFRHFWIFISYHIFLLNQVEGAIAIPPAIVPPAILLSVRLSVRLSVNRSVNHIFRFLHICWQVTGKEWHRVRNADVSRWLTLGQHWCRWVLLSFHAFVRPSNHPWAWVCVLHTKRLEEMAYNLACWCIQMAYTQHSWMLMDIVVGLSVRPSVRLFVYGIFRWLCICWQITWNKWHKIWHDDIVIIGRWLLPSVVDTGDICCHYWQLILVFTKKQKYIRLFHYFPSQRSSRLLKSFLFILHSPSYGCWCHGDTRGQGISSHDVAVVSRDYCGPGTGITASTR